MVSAETVFILTALLATGVAAAVLCRDLPIPYTVLLVLIGLGLEPLAEHQPALEPLLHFRLTPELVLFIFLPTLIFESVCSLDARQLFKNLAPILTLAVPALIGSTLLIGVSLWLLLPITPAAALVFGALISATDPVAVVALFKELGTPQRLTLLVEGESLFNDATAIVLFTILLGLTVHGGLEWHTVGWVGMHFVVVFGSGVLIGVMLGWFGSSLLARLELSSSLVILVSVLLAYTAFILAEHVLHVSGVMATVGCALVFNAFGIPRLPTRIGDAVRSVWEFLALVGNTLLFLLVGLSVNLMSLLQRFDLILLAFALVLLARAGAVYTLVPGATRLFGLPQVTWGERHILWWGGVKGGLAIAMALSIPTDLAERQLLLDLTVGVVLCTLLINAPTIRPLLRKLGIDRPSADERIELRQGVVLAQTRLRDTLGQLHDAGLLSRPVRQQIQSRLNTLLRVEPSVTADDPNPLLREQRLKALRAERQTLEALYQAGIIRQYTFLDLQNELQRERDRVAADPHALPSPDLGKPFMGRWRRLERSFLQRLWEKDWAVGLLARYQNLRLSHHLTQNIARILLTEAALHSLNTSADQDQWQSLEHYYQQRSRRLRAEVAEIQRDFPDFYRRFEIRLAEQTALIAAVRTLDEEYHQGLLGAKAFTLLEQQIHQALHAIPPLSKPITKVQPRELIEMVPLFAGLPRESLDEITQQATPVTFLAGDIIIGQNTHGDALYIVIRGRVKVSHHGPDGETRILAELGPGDFVGETALLGNHVRTADVYAERPSTLLRLTRREVVTLAEHNPALARRLREAREARAEDRKSPDSGESLKQR